MKNIISEESLDEKIGIGVYCKCGGIVYCITNEGYKKDKSEVDKYFNEGYQIGKVSNRDVSKLFGCKCNL